MIELATFLYMMIAMFAVIGYMRGWSKELIATAGIVLALFTIKQFETILIDPLTVDNARSKFYLQAIVLVVIAFFAYQTPPEVISRRELDDDDNVREGIQEGILGALVGAWNGYLLFGSLWWYMDNLEYPLGRAVAPVTQGTSSYDVIEALPLAWMLSGDGSILSIMMIAFFIFVLVAII